ncbi:Nitrogenase iron protein [Frankliniella fusca]|uniref:Nitrogenase iron protein n=1 Tax=Frankliniella fusca TaxID=407009 RepID=A0AAE1HDS2_9NEOP|nr:Nitrogenase iron protein [Frankliniella fusca]
MEVLTDNEVCSRGTRDHALSSQEMKLINALPSFGSPCCGDEIDLASESTHQNSINVWKANVPGQNEPFASSIIDKSEDDVLPRSRKKKRPFSPEPIGITRRNFKMKTKIKGPIKIQKSVNDISGSSSFSCDKCGTVSVVNPSRCRLPPNQIKKIQTARKKIDPVTNTVLNLCNACGLAFSRPPRIEKTSTISVEDRDRYLADAHAFAKDIAQRVGRPAFERLFCPTFKNRPCGCIQTFISHQGEDVESTLEKRVESLLQLFNTACDLNRRRNLYPEYHTLERKSEEKSLLNSTERKQRQKDYEHFVLKTRQLLREKLRLCERACQRILLYSNNFLHKRLKSTPDQDSRIAKQPGRSCSGQLKSIQELGSIPCCSENCSSLALTHSTLLEDWRKQASLGQRQARRVLAEMLTPSGGTKSNCYKFITMVTGCGPTTISSVSHQMRITKGNREPPEHGLRKWYRENPRKKIKTQALNSNLEQPKEIIHVPAVSGANLESTDSINAQDQKKQIEQQKLELEEAKRQLYLKQQELERCQQIIDQHFHQLPPNTPHSEHPWKINVLKNSVKEADADVNLLNLPAQSNLAMMSELTNGQTVQLIDLVPGTYIAVPSEFDSSAILTVSSECKQAGLSDVPLSSNDIQNQQEIIVPESVHSLETLSKTNSNIMYSDDLNSFSNSTQTNQFIIQSENGVHTIFNISASETVGTILKEAECQIEPIGSCNSQDFVSSPAVCSNHMFPNSVGNTATSVSSQHTSHFQQSMNVDTNSALHPMNITDSSHPTSYQTSVITLSGNCDVEKSALQNSTVLPPADCPAMYQTGKSESMVVTDMPSSVNSVILLSSEQPQSTGNSISAFERLFE